MSGARGLAADRGDLATLAERIRPPALSAPRGLPVLEALEGLFPSGDLPRGATVSIDGPASTSLALAVSAAASCDGAWVAALGFPSLGLSAAAELGVALHRLVLVADPGAAADLWSSAVAALVDSFDVVLVRASGRVRASDARRLVARTRERRAVLIQVAGDEVARPWPEGAEIALRVTGAEWEGLGDGFGHLRARKVGVEGSGRRSAARPRRVELWLPSAEGGVELVVPAASVAALPVRDG